MKKNNNETTRTSPGKTAHQKQVWADLGLLLTAMIWGTGFVFSKQAVTEMDPMALMATRFTIAFIISAVVFRKHLVNMKPGLVKSGVIIGVLLLLAYSLQMVGLQYIGAGKQAFLTGTYVVIVPFMFWAVKNKRPDSWNFLSAFIMLGGMACLSLTPGQGLFSNVNAGDIFTIVCAFFFAAQILANGIYAKDYDPIALTVIQLGVASVGSILWCLFAGTPFTGISAEGWLSALYLGVFSSFLCALLQTVCQKYTTPTHAAILMCLETVFGSLASYVFLHEQFTQIMIFGFALIFIAIIISETKLSFLRPDGKDKMILPVEANPDIGGDHGADH